MEKRVIPIIREQFIIKLREYARTFKPIIRPACAHFVSRSYKEVMSAAIPIVNYVPNLANYGIKVPAVSCKEGDMVIFDRTYDAIDPEGIGPEDDMTHVGIVTKWNSLTKFKFDFIHFSANQDKPIEVSYADMPGAWNVNCFRSMEKYFDNELEEELNKKMIVKFIDIDGKSYDADSIEMIIKFNGNVVKLFAHQE